MKSVVKFKSCSGYALRILGSGVLLVLLLAFFSPVEAQYQTLRVPQDYSSIEAAYNAASHGDEILVAPGTYDVCLSGSRTKMIILRAEHPATSSPASQQTILNSACSHMIQFKTPLGDGSFSRGDHVEFIGFVLNGSDDGFSYESASGIVKDNIISGQSDDPIDIDNASEAHIIGNILKDGRGGGDGIENRLHPFSSSREIQMIFMNNVIYNSKKDGIQLIYQGGGHTKRKYLIANNLIINSGQVGLGTSPDSSQNTAGYPLQEQIYVLNNTFVGNGLGGILGGANLIAHNNIFVNNKAVAVKNLTGSSVASHNLYFGNAKDIEGSNDQGSNVNADPNFTNTGSPPDFSSYQLGSGSPAIDAGKAVSSYYSEFGVSPPAYSGSAPDLGWRESGAAGPSPTPRPGPTSTPRPSASPTPQPPTSTPPPGPSPTPTPPPAPKDPDINGDGQVDGKDMKQLLAVWGPVSSSPPEDLDSNGKVNSVDAGILIANWTGAVATPPPGPTSTPRPSASPTPTPGGGPSPTPPPAGALDQTVCYASVHGPSFFSTTIDNEWLPFPVGMVHVLEGGGLKVQISVLNETEVVDGVTTWVIEEREWEGGSLIEVSRNYFVQAQDGTVCYYGEYVDDGYGNPLHGSWRAGENGAKAGIMMPSVPVVGMTWIIEDAQASGAYEDAEITSMGSSYTTPAGTFPNTMHIVEDFGASQKKYTPGVGMIFDDGIKLTSY